MALKLCFTMKNMVEEKTLNREFISIGDFFGVLEEFVGESPQNIPTTLIEGWPNDNLVGFSSSILDLKRSFILR